MKKSSNVRGITVKEENSKKASAFGIDLKEIDLQAVIKMGLEEVMFQARCHFLARENSKVYVVIK